MSLTDARNDIDTANGQDFGPGNYFLLRSIAQSLISIANRLDSIDDALRNTIGGNPT